MWSLRRKRTTKNKLINKTCIILTGFYFTKNKVKER